MDAFEIIVRETVRVGGEDRAAAKAASRSPDVRAIILAGRGVALDWLMANGWDVAARAGPELMMARGSP